MLISLVYSLQNCFVEITEVDLQYTSNAFIDCPSIIDFIPHMENFPGLHGMRDSCGKQVPEIAGI